MVQFQERRRLPRITYFCRVEVGAIQDGRPVSYEGRIASLSEGGFLIVTRLMLPVGSDVQLRIFLQEDEPPIHAKGKVIYDIPQGLGFGIEDISEPDRQRIRDLVNRLLGKA